MKAEDPILETHEVPKRYPFLKKTGWRRRGARAAGLRLFGAAERSAIASVTWRRGSMKISTGRLPTLAH